MTVQLLGRDFSTLHLVRAEHKPDTKYGGAAQYLQKSPERDRQSRKRNKDDEDTEKDKCACAGHW